MLTIGAETGGMKTAVADGMLTIGAETGWTVGGLKTTIGKLEPRRLVVKMLCSLHRLLSSLHRLLCSLDRLCSVHRHRLLPAITAVAVKMLMRLRLSLHHRLLRGFLKFTMTTVPVWMLMRLRRLPRSLMRSLLQRTMTAVAVKTNRLQPTTSPAADRMKPAHPLAGSGRQPESKALRLETATPPKKNLQKKANTQWREVVILCKQ